MNTSKPRLLHVEAVADLPVLWAFVQRLDLPATLDRHFATPLHWKGPLTPGEVLVIWLLFLVSQGDHCLNHLQPWVAQHRGTLSALLGKPVLATCAHDDRLADWLSRLGAGASFSGLEQDLNQQTIRVYQLPNAVVRIDTTTANSYANVLSEQGLLQFGHNRTNLPALTAAEVVGWAKAHHRRTGDWPTRASGAIGGVPGETWHGVDLALRWGYRGLPGGSSLGRLLREHREGLGRPAARP